MVKADPRQIAVEILNRVDQGGYAEPLIDQALSGKKFENIQDRKLLTQIVYGTLRLRGRLDWILGSLYRGRLEKMDPRLRNLIRTGLYQISELDRIPDHAAVNESARIAAALFPARVGLVNAILRNAIRKSEDIRFPDPETEPARFIASWHSHPLWLVEKWIERFGIEETSALCQADNDNAPLCLRVNRIKATRDAVLEELSDLGFKAQKTGASPDGLIIRESPHSIRETQLFREGRIQIQDEASQLIARILDPQPGENILDLCSGIGGKTTHAAALMQNHGRITAIDIHPDKLKELEGLSHRLGISMIRTLAGDATQDLGKEFEASFDRILLDAPCSGLGTLRRNPEIKWRLQPDDIKEFASLQIRTLDRTRHYLREGGILVYSTCSIMREENEDVVEAFLRSHADYKLADMPDRMLKDFTDSKGYFHTFPHRHGMDGFFAARLQRGPETN